MQIQFKNWLVSQGYKEFSASGRRSTAIDYAGRIAKICQFEGFTWEQLAINIDTVLPQYENAGLKSGLGRISHESVKNALRHFKKFSKIKKDTKND